ncbi:carbohydrate sulfotransferase 11-like [Acanthaster planci]|uniref:Carbohydrate sulfotransferase n=1 Tax=Acanthaster planci TaxID=133434 RepID=A0A8B7Y9A7_ACAPL|nr:carbohydrate sulfotransferase 11-like [Acanthaster planci]XP_022088936.1 carbohydrate sulfotransferase 11-like [Acanthaster planci]XP_022088937.1 carbohydrate sulfotransferase 11-like [Acanthaster planci]XP_022088938.1 carbohydrate sulfotransferase 11-like [Acanthaster planci]XP_022088939.1 carbohydrate sulfotransferase 11-like [Acanthaster planci]XP_022088940.1 carbohydrate sulfotransferase 11-like [Acanthaster planci]
MLVCREMARLDRKIRRSAVAAVVLLACLLLVEYRTFYQDKSQGTIGNRKNNPRKEAVMKKPHRKPMQPNKPRKTQEQIESSKSSSLDFLKTQGEVQARRRAILRGTCERREIKSEAEPPKYTRQHIYVVDNYKAMYCFVPKVGCSNWKRILMVLNGNKETVEGLTSEEIHLRANLRFLNSYTPEQQAHRLKNYLKFVFVREPFRRALSVYRNKFEDVGYYQGNEHFHRFGRQIVAKFKKNPSQHDLQTGENATWREFVDYLTHPTERAEVETDIHFSDHWTEMYKLCSPCTIKYDVIGNLETVADDAQYVLELLNAPSKVRYLSSGNSRPTNSSDSGTFHKYFSQLDKLQLTKLWDLYKLDYELFGYPKPSVVPS